MENNNAINIQKKDQDDAPTPQNTPIFTAPIGGNSSAPNSMQMLNNPALSQLLQSRLGNLAGSPSEYIQKLPKVVRDRLAGLQLLQSQHTELEAQFHNEILELEKKYNTLYKPLYTRRYNIISGAEEPSAEEIESGEKLLLEMDPDAQVAITELDSNDQPIEENQAEVKGIDSFWLTALQNHPQTQEMITENDSKALEFLEDLQISYLEPGPGFQVIFKFRENPYFTNSELVKSYHYTQSKISGELVFASSESSKIQWKPEMDLTTTVETKKQRHKTTNKTRIVKKTVPTESFFNFFETIAIPNDEDDSEEAEESRERLEADYELGEEIKEKIVPRAIDWFTGKALEYEDYNDEEFDDDLYDEEDDEDEDDDEDDEDDDEDLSRSQKESEPPQCKQQ
ncbi:putative nucleosome assembly protein [Smittium mucronatum]|uniref:Putative nucleosome assembly protein n=1 Tax=Smittium mucronatum TaxID=133383 RepID=A0A1R0H098_9FUNG|nr:putative nucleosome assembly protein [Smittium mucronatum]